MEASEEKVNNCKTKTTLWEKMHVMYNAVEDDYKVLASPRGRIIAARLNRYKRHCVVLYCCCFVSAILCCRNPTAIIRFIIAIIINTIYLSFWERF